MKFLWLWAALLMAMGCAQEGARPISSIVEVTQAHFLAVDDAAPPDPGDPRFVPVTLPHRPGDARPRGRGGWYLIHLQPPAAEVWGVYLPRLHMNAAVYMNGAFLGDGGRLGEPLSRNWNTPLYFTVPPRMWQPGDNVLHIRLVTHPGLGMLTAVQVGPERLLRPRYELRRFLQTEVSATISLSLCGLALFLLSIWWRRRKDTAYLWLAGASLLWAVYSAYLFIRNPVLPGMVLQWLSHVSLDLWLVLLVGFAHRYIDVQRPRLERTLQCAVGLGALISAVTTDAQRRMQWFELCHLISLAAAAYLALLLVAALRRKRSTEVTLLAVTFGIVLLSGAHDLGLLLLAPHTSLPLLRAVSGRVLFMHHHAAPLLIFALSWHLTRRFTAALNEAEQLNAELEHRVQEGRRELERSFAEHRLLLCEQAAAAARERVYRDLHDDLGAKLLSLAIGSGDPRQAALARSALQDLRDVVSTAEEPIALDHLLADCRGEAARRTGEAQVALDWQQADDLPEVILPPAAALHLRRILREATTNVLRHAGAGRLQITATHGAGRLHLSVVDDGPGGAGWTEGRGLANLRDRTEMLGGTLTLAPEQGSLRVQLPLSRLAEVDPAAQREG